MKVLGLIAGAALLLGAQNAYAVSITNGSFEAGTNPGAFTTVGVGGTNITGWNVTSGSVDYIGTYWTSSDGDRSIDLSGNEAGTLSQTLSGLTVGQQYTVSFDLAGNPAGDPADKLLQISAGNDNKLISFPTAGQSLTDMGWVRFTFNFVATAADNTLSFISKTAGFYGPAIDNVSIATTPIPGAILLFGTALSGMGFFGYRRKKLEAAA